MALGQLHGIFARHDAGFCRAALPVHGRSTHAGVPAKFRRLRTGKWPNSGGLRVGSSAVSVRESWQPPLHRRSEEHTSELQSQSQLVCRLLLEKKKKERLAALIAARPDATLAELREACRT